MPKESLSGRREILCLKGHGHMITFGQNQSIFLISFVSSEKKRAANIYLALAYARHCSEHFISINSFNLHNNH